MPPCWSCEGHEDRSGKVYKPPRIWFTARTVFYPDLISERLAQLRAEKRLAAEWHVRLVDCGLRTEATFSIEPKDSAHGVPSLAQLQRDVCTIADGLPDAIKALARNRLYALTKAHT